MSEAPSQAPTQDRLPEVEQYLSAELQRKRFIAQGQAFLADLYQWLRDNNAKSRGRAAISRFTKAHDALISLAYAHVVHHWTRENGKPEPRIAVVAIGGYGRRELFLRSDVDLLILMDQKPGDEAQSFVKSLLHLLIDMRLNLGYSTRTLTDCEGLIGRDQDSTTSMVESRLIIGSKPLFSRFSEMISHNVCSKWRKWFLKVTYQQWSERREKYESTVYLLEPNLKEGTGGLRDVHTVLWTLFALSGAADIKGLKELAGFEEEELRQFRESVAMIQTVRNEVHIASGGKNDQLLFTFQPAIAKRLGYEAEAHRTAEEVFMADYYRNARDVARLAKRAIRVLMRREKSLLSELFGSLRRKRLDAHLVVQDNVIFIDREHFSYFEQDSGRVMELFERACRLGYHLSDETLDFLTRLSGSLSIAFRLDPATQEHFLRILKTPGNVARTIGDMHECGVLDKFLPEFERISCMVRLDYYHQYTVDEHSIKALDMAERLYKQPAAGRSFAGQIARQIKRWDLLFLALLLHDVGKGYGRGHALRGGQLAQRVGDRLHLSPADVETVRFLVLSHLKLSHAAQRRDLSDPQVAKQLAAEIGTLERLKLLYVHSVCDLMAVSPEAWTDWKDQLLAECYMRTAEVLGEKHPHKPKLAPNLPILRQKVLAAIMEETSAEGSSHVPEGIAPGASSEEVSDFLTHLSDRYIQASSPATIARHFLMRRTLDDKNVLEWRLLPDTGAGFSELTICAADVPGLFNNICGALAAKDINIWSAQIFSTTDGVAINQFQVTDLENKPLPAGLRLERLRHDLNQVILGAKTIESLIEKHRGRGRRKPRVRSPLPSTVLIDNTSSQECTVIEVRSADRPGLLYQITRALSECHLDIQRAIITTEAYGIVDVFYVTDLEYNKIYDASQRKRIEQTILDAIAV